MRIKLNKKIPIKIIEFSALSALSITKKGYIYMNDLEIRAKKIKALLTKETLAALNYSSIQFIRNYSGDVLQAAIDAGWKGDEKTLRVKVSQMKRAYPAVVPLMEQVNLILAEGAQLRANEAMKTVDMKDMQKQIEAIKDDLDFSALTTKQERLVLNYQGSLPAAIEISGYVDGVSSDDKKRRIMTACYNVRKNPLVRAALEAVDKVLNDTVAMSTTRAKILLTEFAEDETLDNKQRQAALNTLLKTQGALTEKLIVQQHSSHIERRELIINITGGGAMTIPIEHCK